MRIAYDHQIFGWQEYGGISRYFFELANGLAADDACDVAAISPLYVTRYLADRRPALRVWGRRVPRVPKSGRACRALNALFVPRLLRRFDPHVVHETYYSRRRLAPAKAAVVVTVFDMIHELFPQNFSRFDPTAADKAAAVARADHVICISESTRRDLVALLGVPAQKTSVVHLGSALPAPADDGDAAGEPYLLYVGLRGGYKNFAGLLRAYASSARLAGDFRLVCFGGGPFSAEEARLIDALKLPRERIAQVSGDDARLAAHYARAAALVYPSLYEGFGIPPLEAMAAGCPVVCGDVAALPEVVADAARLCDPHADDALRAAIEDVVYSPSRRAELVARGRQRAGALTWGACARNTLEVYRRLSP